MTKAIEREKIFQIGRHAEPAFRAVIVDRDSMSGGLLADALVRELKCEASAVRAANLLQVLAARPVDLVVISADLSASPGVGYDLANSVSCAHPKVPIVLLLDQTTQAAVINSFRSGARGVFNRQESIGEFINCIERVRKGAIWAGAEESNLILEAFKGIPAPMALTEGSSSTLTTRELQVVRCAATGKTNKTIAVELGLSEHTVKNYLFRAFEKLGVSSRVELLFYLTIRGHDPWAFLWPDEDSAKPGPGDEAALEPPTSFAASEE
jgi:DNA-binding NarL/FixJ family response regulator